MDDPQYEEQFQPVPQKAVPVSTNLSPGLARHFNDFETIIENVSLALQGLGIDASGNVIRVGEPIMTSDGAAKFVSYMRSVMNYSFTLSNLDKDRPYNWSRVFGFMIAEQLMAHLDEFGIKDELDAEIAIYPPIMAFLSTCLRAVNEGERRFIRDTSRETFGTEQKKRGWLGL